MGTNSRAAGVLVAVGVMVSTGACGGGSSPVSDARQHLTRATAVSITAHFADDAAHHLKTSMLTGSSPLTKPEAQALSTGSITLEVAARNGRTVAAGAKISTLSDVAKAYDVSGTVQTEGHDLFQFRLVGGTLYGAADLDLLDKLSALSGGAPATKAAAPVAKPYLDALRGGQWLQFPLASTLDLAQGALPAQAQHPATYAKLIPQTIAVLRRDVVVKTQSTSGDSATVALTVQVRAVADDFLRTLSPIVPPGALPTPADVAKQVTTGSLAATVQVQSGHFTRLTVPLEQLVKLDPHPGSDVPNFGGSSVVVDIDDSAAPITVPTNLSQLSILRLLANSG
jgi:hypothetical protein